MGYPRIMGAGLAGSTTKMYGNANVNQIQYGDKLQGLPPVTGLRRPYRIYRSKAGGNAPGRYRVFCANQLGGVGNVKNSQFAPNADGVGWCPNRLNARNGHVGIHATDRHQSAASGQAHAKQPRGTLLQDFAVLSPVSYGVWAANFNAWNTALTPRGLDRLYIGAFEPDCTGSPDCVRPGVPKVDGSGGSQPVGKTEYGSIRNILPPPGTLYVTLGGVGSVGDSLVDPPEPVHVNPQDLVDTYNEGFKFDGLDFDMEGLTLGSLPGSIPLPLVGPLTTEVVTAVEADIGKPLAVQFTVLGSLGTSYAAQFIDLVSSDSTRDYKLAVMFYGEGMTSGGWGLKACGSSVDVTQQRLTAWINAMGPHKDKLILGMAVRENDGCYISKFQSQVLDNGLVGINIWQSSTGLCTLLKSPVDDPQLKPSCSTSP